MAKFHVFTRSYGKQRSDVAKYCDMIILKKQRRGQGGRCAHINSLSGIIES